MSKLLLSLILIISSGAAYAVDYYTSIKSSLFETITEGLNVQLIHADTAHNYLLVKARSPDILRSGYDEFKYSLTKQGYLVDVVTIDSSFVALAKFPIGGTESVLNSFIAQFSGTTFIDLELIVFGEINQQRLLGSINRSFKASDIRFGAGKEELGFYSYQQNLPKFEPFATIQETSDWRLGLTTALLNCGFSSTNHLVFNYYPDSMSCSDYHPKASLTDKDVANLRDDLYAKIQLAVESPESFLLYISSFKAETRIEQSQSFYVNIPSIGIDNILAYQYRYLLRKSNNDKVVANINSIDTTYQMPLELKSKSKMTLSRTTVIQLELMINSATTCLQLNCESLAVIPYINYSNSADTHVFAVKYSSSNETTVIDELNKVLFIPLSTAKGIAQENVSISLTGGYLLEAYDESFRLIAQLPVVKANLDYPHSSNHLVGPYTGDPDVNLLEIKLVTLPGGEGWSESELFYFILVNQLAAKIPKASLSKSNTLVRTSVSNFSYSQFDGSTIYMSFGSKEQNKLEEDFASAIELIQEQVNELSRNDFVGYKSSLQTNLRLIEAGHQSYRRISLLFDIDNPQSLLLEKLDPLSFEQYQSFVSNTLVNARFNISSEQDLSKDFKDKVANFIQN
ncbi:hypothetical protein [Kangiella koreensis]|uniref:Peptidase M16 domain protein n=1 Tax=Kangiella koreensis (strain DSM 16069 / JCM 12317 / KCTC 12182 / SW-125) TaxID=523791 RepID=C7R6C0_KANKD|nr:hypothetical protein [Kangiella koreensis]ACV27348.1 hypothetical protein Kkor_1938 [Kangiella koreensis DSM 16069]